MKKTRRIMALLLCLMLLVSACGPAAPADDTTAAPQTTEAPTTEAPTTEPAPTFTAGTYKGSAVGANGPLSLSVTIDENGAIADIDYSDNVETIGLGKTALAILTDQVLEAQSSNIDTITGSTVTTIAFKAALNAALTEAGLADRFAEAPEYVHTFDSAAEDMKADVVIVGAGLSGLMAAIGAADKGLDVVLLEKNPYPGGDMIVAIGWITAHGNRMQVAAETPISMTPDKEKNPFNYKVDFASGAAADAMMDYGVELLPTTNANTGFAPGYEKGGGIAAQKLAEKAESVGVKILYNTPGVELVDKGGAAVGVIAERADGQKFTVHGNAVVLACGGYQCNPEMVEKYTGLTGMRCPSNPANTGDAFIMAEKFDAALYGTSDGIHMQVVTAATNRGIAFSLGPSVMVDAKGDRFANEASGYNPVGHAAVDKGVDKMYLIIDQADADTEFVPGNTQLLVASGCAKVFKSVKEIADHYGMPNLEATITKYNDMAAAGEDTDFGRTNFSPLEGDTLYVVEAMPAIYASYTGLLIDEDFRVQNNAGETITGLYAIGAASGTYRLLEGMTPSSPGLAPAISAGYLLPDVLIKDLGK